MNKSSTLTHRQEVRRMFSRIASRYDLLNRLMTLGQDRRWRRQALRGLNLSAREKLLDIGTGTGDLAFEACDRIAGLWIVACDFTPAMIQHAQRRQKSRRIHWVVADAQALPFADGSFDAAVSGFLLRNVSDLDRTLSEQARILAREGRAASLDTTPPEANFLKPFLQLYLNRIIPILGRWFARDEAAYRYLPETTQAFLPAAVLAKQFRTNGFDAVDYSRRMFGTIAIHQARKASRENILDVHQSGLRGSIQTDD